MCWVRIVFLGSYDVQRWLSNSFGVLEEVPLVDPATLASGLSACCTTVANGLSLIIITALNKRRMPVRGSNARDRTLPSCPNKPV
jgi:hypothetical protein